ncbi:hypothetical protein Ancab_036160 [Ancistrocladus abbreviatus]
MMSVVDKSNDHKACDTNSTKKFDSYDQKTRATNSSERSGSNYQTARVTNSSGKSAEVIQPKKFKPFFVPICNFSDPKSDFCEINDGDVRVHGNSSTIFIVSSSKLFSNISAQNTSWSIKPYARKNDHSVMERIREFSLKTSSSYDRKSILGCSKNHSLPGIIFSAGGYAGNQYHDFSDVIIPLYTTSRHFKGEVKFLVANAGSWWLGKYRILLKALSNHDIIDIDRDQEIHCFSSMIVGLKSHKEFGFDSSRPGPDGNFSMPIFTQFLRRVFSLKRDSLPKLRDGDKRKPRLYIMARARTRKLANVDEIAAEARSLGFDVEVFDAKWNLEEFAKMVNSFDVMVGVHGAGLTNNLFLPQRAVVIQIVPLGLEWLAKYDYELPARAMNLRYLDYKISVNESTLIDNYPIDHPVFTDPHLYSKQGWGAFKKIYMDTQNVRLDIGKFRTSLLKAIELLRS